MKKLLAVAVVLLAWSGVAFAGQYGQVTCSNTATVLGSATPGAYKSFIIQNQTPAVGVYIGPDANVTSGTGGILLSAAEGLTVSFENGDNPWYCITASSSATVGYNITAR